MHRNNILVYNSNKMHKSQSLFYLTTALHVSGVIITHFQEHKTTVTTASGNRYTVLLSAAIHDSSRQQYGVTVTRCCSYSFFVLLKTGDSDARNMLSDKINSVTCASCWNYILERSIYFISKNTFHQYTFPRL